MAEKIIELKTTYPIADIMDFIISINSSCNMGAIVRDKLDEHNNFIIEIYKKGCD